MAKARSPIVRTVVGFGAAYSFAILAGVFRLGDRFSHLMMALRADETTQTLDQILRLSWIIAQSFASAYMAALFVATLLVPLGAVVRMVARARVRAGFRDPLERTRQFGSRPVASTLLVATPALWWLAVSLRVALRYEAHWDLLLPVLALPMGTAFAAHVLLARNGLRALLAPTLVAGQLQETTAEGFSFNAVAVTRETVGAVGGLAALSLVMATIAFVLPTPTLVHNPGFLAALVGYIVIAIGGTLLFRRASRISVGLDGIFVSGSARKRFVPFSEIDDAMPNGSSIELKRGSTTVLRLQLHGEDAARRDALAERIRAAIAVAAALRNTPDVDFVRSAKQDAIERAAGGASSYREAAPTREKLWELLESPAIDANGRKAAATALSRQSNDSEKVRLRVAAEHCAEPSVRARIYELLEDDEEPLEVATSPSFRARL